MRVVCCAHVGQGILGFWKAPGLRKTTLHLCIVPGVHPMFVLTYSFLSKLEFKFRNPEALWMYLSSWHDWVNITSWISDSQLEGNPAKWPPLPLEAIGQSALCSHYLRNEVLDVLAR